LVFCHVAIAPGGREKPLLMELEGHQLSLDKLVQVLEGLLLELKHMNNKKLIQVLEI
jgi:hypothetical protein